MIPNFYFLLSNSWFQFYFNKNFLQIYLTQFVEISEINLRDLSKHEHHSFGLRTRSRSTSQSRRYGRRQCSWSSFSRSYNSCKDNFKSPSVSKCWNIHPTSGLQSGSWAEMMWNAYHCINKREKGRKEKNQKKKFETTRETWLNKIYME